ADNMYRLLESLKSYEHHYSVYPFGEFVHYTDKREDFNPQELQQYLEAKNHQNIKIEITKTTIEDTFMELAK
ncbi:MAG: ABC transporter ATP-binding protein, partial [Lutibacter sp.]|nr:ABC transporter ATP-binding protein [Lutibacter sp.]